MNASSIEDGAMNSSYSDPSSGKRSANWLQRLSPLATLSKLAMPFLGSQRTLHVDTAEVTRLGVLHERDGLPNQDSSFSMQLPGTRTKPKRSIAGQRANAHGVYIIGVFDGHGDTGECASEIASRAAQDYLRQNLLVEDDPEMVEETLVQTFEHMAAAVNAHPCSEDSGTTGTIAVVCNGEIYIAHAGDSAALVISSPSGSGRERARYVTPMHRTIYESERNRIVKAGGLVMEGYVVDKATKAKGIGVTRTIGDSDMLKNGCIPTPEVKRLPLRTGDMSVVIATDGLWDVEGLVIGDVLKATRETRSEGAAERLAQSLMDIAVQTGPSDDCTICTMTFRTAETGK